MSNRTRPRLFVFVCVIALAAISVATSAGALGQSTPPSVTAETTLPSGDDPAHGELDAMRPAVEQYAAEYGLTFDEAVEQLQAEACLTQYAGSLRGKDGYAGFKVEHTDEGVRGVLALTDASLPTSPPDLRMRVVSARVAEQDQVSLGERLTADLKATWIQAAATTYDPFDDTVTIWRTPGQGWKASDDSDIADRVRGLLGSAFAGARVRFEEPLTAETFYGGQRESKSSSFLFFTWTSAECTSAFGVSKYISGSWRYGYITAGHCRAFGGTGWKVHRGGTTYTVQAYHDQLLGGYRGRSRGSSAQQQGGTQR